MDNITLSLENGTGEERFNPTTLTAIFGGIIGILTVITGYLLKAHIHHSSCYNGRCFDCVCIDSQEKEEVEKTLKRIRTEKRNSINLEGNQEIII